MSDTEAPNPYEGAADIDQAADILASQMEAAEAPNPDEEKKPKDQPPPEEADADDDAEPEATDSEDDEEADDAESDEEQPDAEDEDADEGDEEPAEPTFTVTVQGETKEVSLDELRSGYMMHEDYSRKSRALADDRKAFSEQREHLTQATQAQLQEVGFLANQLMQEVIGSEQDPELQNLRSVDPGEYSARLAEINRKKELLSRAYNAHQQQQQTNNQFSEEQMREHLTREQDLLLTKLPGWTDPKVAQAEKGQLAKYLESEGFQEAEIKGLSDHRAVVMARKAMLFDQLQEKKQQVKKKVKRPVPNVRKARAESTSVVEQQRKQAKGRLRKLGTVDAAAEFLLAGIEE